MTVSHNHRGSHVVVRKFAAGLSSVCSKHVTDRLTDDWVTWQFIVELVVCHSQESFIVCDFARLLRRREDGLYPGFDVPRTRYVPRAAAGVSEWVSEWVRGFV